MESLPKFAAGQLVCHLKFGYRGVIVSVDPSFSGSDEWYDTVARSRPPRDRPWYHVLVHGAKHRTYVAERHLDLDRSGAPVEHPEVAEYFDELRDGAYRRSQRMN